MKTILRSFGTYYDNGTIPFTFDEWHQLVFTFDGTSFKTYLDGVGGDIRFGPGRSTLMMVNWVLVELLMVTIFSGMDR